MSIIHIPSDVVVLAMDVHKNTISAGVLEPDSSSVVVDRIGTDEESIRRLVARFEEPTLGSTRPNNPPKKTPHWT